MMLTGPYLVVAHLLGMYRDLFDPKGKENGAYCFVGDYNKLNAPMAIAAVTKTWLSTKSLKQGPIDNAPITGQMTVEPTQLWGGYESLNGNKKETKEAPAMVLLCSALVKGFCCKETLPCLKP